MACYLSKPVFKWPSNGFSHALPSDTRCCSARLSSQLDKVEVGFFFSISLSRLFLPRQASVCHIVGMRLAPTSFETYAAELIERFSAGEEGDHMIYLSQRRPCKSHPAADEEAGKKKKTIEMLARLIIRLELGVRGKQPFAATCLFVRLSATVVRAVFVHTLMKLY